MYVADITQFYSSKSGGVRRYLQEKSSYLHQHGHQHLLIIPGEKTGCFYEGGSKIYTIASPLVIPSGGYRLLLNFELIQEILIKERPNLIESADPYQISWKLVSFARSIQLPTVGFYHSHFSQLMLQTLSEKLPISRSLLPILERAAVAYTRHLYQQFDHTIVSNLELENLLSFWGIKNISRISLGVDTKIFKPKKSSSQKREKHEQDPFHILYVGRLSGEKNLSLLLKTILFLRGNPRFYFTLIGEGPLSYEVSSLVEKNSQVHWIQGCYDKEKLAAFYQEADLFIHPGMQETFGLVLLESQACGTPVLAIKGSSLEPLLFSPKHFRIERNDPDALLDFLLNKLNHQELTLLSQRGIEIVQSQYDWEKVFESLLKLYSEIIFSYSKKSL